MRLEFRTNNAYDSVLLVGEKDGADVVCNEWCLDLPGREGVFAQFLATTDPGEWEPLPGGVHGEPSNWGELVATMLDGGNLRIDDAERMVERLRFHLGDAEGSAKAETLSIL